LYIQHAKRNFFLIINKREKKIIIKNKNSCKSGREAEFKGEKNSRHFLGEEEL
jgi:hypothetical protein